MNVYVALIVNVDDERKASKIVQKVHQFDPALGILFEPYSKGGFKVSITLPLEAANWPAAVLEVLSLAQSFGRGWTVLGIVAEELSLVCNEFSVSGISWAEILGSGLVLSL